MSRSSRTPASTDVAIRAGGMAGLVVALTASLALAGCGTSPDQPAVVSSTAASGGLPTAGAAATSPAPAAQQVPLGKMVVLPTDTVVVSRFLDHAAPSAVKPDTSGTHWASFDTTQCATAESKQTRWKVALADGGTASEPSSWGGDLPHVRLPMDETFTPGFCEKGSVYVEMPDGAVATAVVLQPSDGHPVRPEVRWVIGRTSAAS